MVNMNGFVPEDIDEVYPVSEVIWMDLKPTSDYQSYRDLMTRMEEEYYGR